MTALALHAIGKSYRDKAVLRSISLDVRRGEFLALLGPSGCGKSTLLRIIAGLETPDMGEVRIDSRRANDLAPSERDISMVFQSYALYPHKTVFENIALCLQMRRLKPAQRLPGAALLSRAVRQTHMDIGTDVRRAAQIVPRSSPAASGSVWLWLARWSAIRACS
jgi:multiple sugar transport system ATP-binding protein